MIYLTQLIYIKPGKEAVFLEFESIAIPIIPKYNGQLLLRLRPENDIVESSIIDPYEIHLISFDTEKDFENFMQDDERKKFLHLKKDSILATLLIKGNEIG